MTRPPVRFALWAWPALGLALVAAAGLVWTWTADLPQRQDRILRTVVIAGATVILELLWLVLWLFVWSRVRRRVGLAACAVAAVIIAGAAALLRFEGFSGDVVPRVDWRWERVPGELPVAAAPALRAAPTEPTALDYPQYLGIHRDGTVAGVRLAADWAGRPPRLLWRQPIGAGWSGFAVVGDQAVTLEQRAGEELVSAYDLATGALSWTDAEHVRHEDPAGGPGPRATPAITDGRVYAIGGTGLLRAVDLSSGQRLWSADLLQDAGGQLPTYGVSNSPLVIDGVVYATAGRGGRTLLAYDAETGKLLWTGGADRRGETYSSPASATLDGVPQILLLDGSHLTGHDPVTGIELWHHPWLGDTQHVSQPIVVSEHRIFLSTGYGVGGRLFEVHRELAGAWRVDVVWESLGLKAKFTNVVHRNGYLYGLDDGILACIAVASGERQWKGGRYGHGQTLLVGDRLLVLAEDGEVALVAAEPNHYAELGRFQAIGGKSWSHPALAGARLIVRNDREAACYELPLDD